MPRVHINLHDIDEIEDLEDQSDWEELIGLAGANPRRDALTSTDTRPNGVRRFGGADALDRKRADRRKSFNRPSKKF
jgi:hypothetical protein